MAKVIDYWSVNLWFRGREAVDVIKTAKPPVVEDGFIHIEYSEGGTLVRQGYSLSKLDSYAIAVIMKGE